MKLALVTDAWYPQLNGVVRSLDRTRQELAGLGHQVEIIHPGLFRSVPCPTYPEIRLAWNAPWAMSARLRELAADAVHVATEGPLGWAARGWCLGRRIPFTTSFHTRFPEYLQARTGLPVGPGYALFRRFHNRAARTMVATDGLRDELAARGFRNLVLWSRGVDSDLFRPRDKTAMAFPRPIHLYFGRVAVEKNVGAFLDLDLPGSKEDVDRASRETIAALDEGFFRVRFDRLTPAEKLYLRAMAELGPGPHRSGDIAEQLGRRVTSLGPTRNQLIAKGMIWSPSHGDTAFTVPLFDEFMRRIMPGEDWMARQE